MSKWLLIIICFLISCSTSSYHYTHTPINTAQPKIIPVYIDTTFSRDQKAAIYKVVGEWNVVLNGYVKLDIVSSSFDMDEANLYTITTTRSITILNIDSRSNIIPPAAREGEVIDAFCYMERWIYMISDRMDDMTKFSGVLRHEISHALRGNHIPRAKHLSLMNPIYSDEGNACIDYWTIEEVAKENSLDPQKLNYCTRD